MLELKWTAAAPLRSSYALCTILGSNEKLDYINKIGIFEISVMSTLQKCKNFQNRMVDSYFLPLWQRFANSWLLKKEFGLFRTYSLQ